MVLIVAYETTVNLIANVLRMVLTDPRFRARLSGGHMTVPDAVEQTLWDEPPFTTVLGRWAIGDTELGGQQIKAGDMLLVGIAAGQHRSAVRPDTQRPWTAIVRTWPSAAARTSARARTSGAPSPTSGSTPC